jgi:hypothetical protein
MNPIEIAVLNEIERKKCIKYIKNYYNKYGNENIEKLYDYLQSQLKNTSDSIVISEINYDISLLEDYKKLDNNRDSF